MIGEFERTKAEVVIAFQEVPAEEVVHYGIAEPRGQTRDVFELETLVEKPGIDEAPSNLAVAARYVFSPAIFQFLDETRPGKGGEIQLTDAIRLLLKSGGKGIGIRLPPEEKRFAIGNFESYFRAFTEFALSDQQCGPLLREHVRGLLDSDGKV